MLTLVATHAWVLDPPHLQEKNYKCRLNVNVLVTVLNIT
jgi:hypothetical protein